MTTHIYDRLGKTIRRSRNLRGLMDHYRAKPEDVVIKVTQDKDYRNYPVTVFWPISGDQGHATFADWRVLLDWIGARRSWSVQRVTFDAPLYDLFCDDARVSDLRKAGIPVTRHAYAS
jgi:hypothetical protein